MENYIVDINDFIENIHLVQSHAQNVPIWAVVKGNGYGLGIKGIVSILFAQGIRQFCVSELEDVRTIREICGAQVQILMLQPTTNLEILSELIRMDAICTISSWEDAVNLNNAALDFNKNAMAHLKLDTGMGRYGFTEKELPQILNIYQYLDGIDILGSYTHFASSYQKKTTKKQYALFCRILNQIRSAGFDPGICHCCNSTAFFQYPEMHMDGVRIGSAFLGRMTINTEPRLHKIGFCESRIEELHHLLPGMATGYGGTWKAKRDTTLAIVPIGWYHGFCTQHNSTCSQFRSCLARCICLVKSFLHHQRVWVKVTGENCPVCGRVGMLHTAIDVTDIKCSIGDKVTLDINPLLQKGLSFEYRENTGTLMNHQCP